MSSEITIIISEFFDCKWGSATYVIGDNLDTVKLSPITYGETRRESLYKLRKFLSERRKVEIKFDN